MAQRSFHEHIYRWHEEVENLEGYGPGGYHPVNIGEVYSDGRYRVVHKLGWGGYSTVWLAHDLQSNRYVALKIVVAEASQDSTENRVWRQLSHRIKEGYGGTNFVASLLDDFYINGPNGRHLCLVTEPNRVSVKGSKEEYHPWMFSLQIARAIAAQAILGLQAIHRSGFVHGGRTDPT